MSDASTLVLTVPPEAAGARLDRFLASVEEVGSRAAAERLLAGRKVRVDGETRPKTRRVPQFAPPSS